MSEFYQNFLDEEIVTQVKSLSACEPGSQEYAQLLKTVGELHRLKIEDERDEFERSEKRESREHDRRFKEAQLRESIIDRYCRIGVAAAELVLPLMFYGVWMKRGFEFEKDGTFTSQTFRSLFNQFRPKKK